MTQDIDVDPIIYWHRELPPLAAKVIGDGEVEANSRHIAATLANRDRLWDQCLAELMTEARTRLEQEVRRCVGRYAHVMSESIDPKRNDATGETWLHGRFRYVVLV